MNYVHLAENAGEETADRFLRQADVTFALLAEQPEIGVALTLRAPQLAGLRKWRVQDFEKFLIFLFASARGRVYRPRDACRAGLVGAARDHLKRVQVRRRAMEYCLAVSVQIRHLSGRNSQKYSMISLQNSMIYQ